MRKLIFMLAFLLLAGVHVVYAQTTISGTVTDDNGDPVPGANVRVKGYSDIGTITDLNGTYSLNVPVDATTLVYSFVGMAPKEVEIAGQTVLNVTLSSEDVGVEEVVVVAYGTTKKESFTGSATTVKADKLAELPVVSLDQAISGYVAGVQSATGSGQPGSLSSIRIRGTGSINSNQEPLYVVDGIPIPVRDIGSFSTSSTSSLASINPSDVQSITVLKDAAAASLYGSRAANGVILITTKSGSAGKTKFSFKAETGLSDFATSLPELATPAETYEYKLESIENAYLYYGFSEAEAVQFSQEDMDGYFPQYDPSRPDSDYDWRDALFRKGKTQSYEFNISGGNEKTQFFTSFSTFKSEGVAVGSNFERLTARVKVDHKANDFITLGINTNLNFTKQKTIPANSLYYKNPVWATNYFLVNLIPIKDEEGEFTEIQGGAYPNLVKDLNTTLQQDKIYHTTNQAYVELEIIEGLKLRSTLGFDYRYTKGHQYWSPISNDGESYDGFVWRNNYTRQLITNSNILTYSKSLMDVHNLNVMLGMELEEYSIEQVTAAGSGFPNDYISTLDVSAEPLTSYSHTNKRKMNSYFSRLDYNFDNKYYFSASFRRDGSSQFGADSRWGNFWSVSGAWRISQEAFLSTVDWLNDLKVRASYGTNGNLPIDPAAPTDWQGALPLYEFGASYNNVPGMTNAQIENKELSWEKNENLSVATEFRVFDRFTVEFEYFNRKTSDLLLQVPVSRMTGFNWYWGNVGEMTNKGFEATISSVNFSKGGFVWTTDLTFFHYKNEITKLYEGEDIQDDFPMILREGESYNSFFLRDWAGVNPETGSARWYILDEDENRVDEDGDGEYDLTENTAEAGKKIVGNGDPDLMGSINNTLSYKGIELSFLFTYKLGGETYGDLDWRLYDDGEDINGAITKDMYNRRWQQPGDNELPIIIQTNPQHTNYNSSRRVHDASYLRLKNITLAYNLPKAWVEKVKLSNVKVYATGFNLLTWAAYDKYEPEVNERGIGMANSDFPSLKTYTFGIQLDF